MSIGLGGIPDVNPLKLMRVPPPFLLWGCKAPELCKPWLRDDFPGYIATRIRRIIKKTLEIWEILDIFEIL